jgi:hypothetical protein
MTITGLFMGWTDPVTKNWFPLKKMTWNQGKYYTVYLQGMLLAMQVSEAHRTSINAGLAKLDRVAISNDIHVSFKVRMPVNRPYTDTLRLTRLGLSTDLRQFDPFEYIARSGGYNGGDTRDLCAETTPDKFGKYHFHFGSGDIKGLEISEYILNRLQVNDRLILKDRLIYHQDFLLGKAPGYIADLAKHHPQAIELTVAKINHDLFRFGKILCHASIDSKITIPFSDSHYQPLVDVLAPVG